MPTPIFNSPFYEQVWVQAQPALRTFSNSSGTWNSSGAQLVRAMSGSVTINPNEAWVPAQWKHGSRSQLPKYRGRKGGNWALNIPLAPSGTPGTVPDCDPILQSIFGGPPTVSAGVSATYNIYDQGEIPFGIFDFSKNTTATGNRYALGCMPGRVTITFNGNLLEIQCNGPCVTAVQNEEFSVIDSVAKGGLTSFPTAPGSFSLIGNIIPGFGAVLTMDGNQILQECDSFQVELATGYGLKGDFVDDAYPARVIKELRVASVNVGMMNSSDSALANLKQKARQGAAISASFVLGTTSGYIVTVGFTGLQLNDSSIQEQGGYFSCNFGQSEASVAPGNSNEFYIQFS